MPYVPRLQRYRAPPARDALERRYLYRATPEFEQEWPPSSATSSVESWFESMIKLQTGMPTPTTVAIFTLDLKTPA